MAITLNYTTIDPAESADDWEAVEDGKDIADSSYPPKQGDECVEFDIDPNKQGGIRNKNAIDPFSCKEYEVGAWFLNPKVDKDGKEVIANQDDGLFLRLYSSNDNYADYYQPQHRFKDGTWKGGWLYLRAGGDVGDEDRNSGTWTADDIANIVKVAVMVNSGDGDTTDKDSGKFGVDWTKYYNKIIISGDNDGDPYTLQDILNTDEDKDSGGGVWGVVSNSIDFYNFYCGIEFGDGNDGSFTSQNEYIYIEQLNDNIKFDVSVKNNFNLTFGEKDVGSSVYTKNGIKLFTNGKGDFNIEDGAIVKIYNSIISGFNVINVGDGNDNVDVEIIDNDFYRNNEININSSGVIFDTNRIFYEDDEKVGAGNINKSDSNTFTKVKIFNTDNGFIFNEDTEFIEYNANSNNYDLAIKDEKNVILKNSSFDDTKIKRV